MPKLAPPAGLGDGWGGRRDLNPRQPDPQSGALTRLSYDHHQQDTNLIFAMSAVKVFEIAGDAGESQFVFR